ncbi:checkpoint protein kinase [Moniliophthora roreri MCA 2997]|uniref:Checkpoint protein kinase n=1 Tax=Moniliophthora roreri (strain MCA 2997) TaxID=1381753 RepID=V2XQZ3_MONRO|nr:checkpoint protein kinase [Moniliophthora roreri MCA 2997]
MASPIPPPPSSSPPPSSPPKSRGSSPDDDDDESHIEELSFTYSDDGKGNIVRLARGSGPSLASEDILDPLKLDLELLGTSNQSPTESAANVNVVRFSRGSSSTSTPTDLLDPGKIETSSKATIQHLQPPPETVGQNPTSPGARRASLSRSESAYSVMSGPPTATSERDRAARSFQRVASGPTLTNGSSTSSSSGLPTRLGARRAVADSQHAAQQKRNTEELRQKLMSSAPDYQFPSYSDEKENLRGSDDIPSVAELYGPRQSSAGTSSHGTSSSLVPGARVVPPVRSTHGSSRPLAHAPVNSVSAGRVSSRILKGVGAGSKYTTIDKISEVGTYAESDAEDRAHRDSGYGSLSRPSSYVDLAKNDTDIEEDPSPSTHQTSSRSTQQIAGTVSLNTSSNTRPRRSASMSDPSLRNTEEHAATSTQTSQRQPQSMRPGTSLGLRREVPVVPSRKSPEDVEPATYAKREDYAQSEYQQARQSPSPTHNAPSRLQTSRPVYSHKRRDSDTLRSAAYPQQTVAGSPTVVDGAVPAYMSPSAKMVRTSSAGAVAVSAKHRRSPTAPEPPTTSSSLKSGATSNQVGRTWAPGDRNSGEGYDVPPAPAPPPVPERETKRERERERVSRQQRSASVASHHPSPPQPAPQAPPVPHISLPPPSKSSSSSSSQNRGGHIAVNRKLYARLDMVGKGGSSRVYRVMDGDNNIFAIKRVNLENTDGDALQGYMNEIALLNRLAGNSRIIRLLDSEVKLGSGNSKGHLFLVMECGEIDLARLLQERISEPLCMLWVAYYWQQMLQAVQVIHNEKIVHSDLKPANFVMIKGQLKLIDFGIANAIANDTTNMYREHQVGTLNYMSPEAIELPDGMARLKVGRQSDVWSLGCILYQMIYTYPPFHHLTPYQKMKAIPDPSFSIEYPEYAVPVKPVPKDASPTQRPTKMYDKKQKVRRDVIRDIQSCLLRNPKERMTIPELLKQDWLSMEEKVQAPTPSKWDLLEEGETIIDSHYMKQLLCYGIKLGETGRVSEDPVHLEMEAMRLVNELKSICKPTSDVQR